MPSASSQPASGIVGVILIGGRSMRMGRPKHTLDCGGASLLARTAAVLRPFTGSLMVAGEGEMPGDAADLERIADVDGLAGPLAGILAALRRAGGRAVLVVACDMPNLTTAALEWLCSERVPTSDSVIPLDHEGVSQPLCAVYEARSRTAIERMAALGITAPRRLVEFAPVASPRIPDHLLSAWRNVNTPGEWADRGALPP